jgi:hypothetical protein
MVQGDWDATIKNAVQPARVTTELNQVNITKFTALTQLINQPC